VGRFHFKRAETATEIEQVHRLNYRTFVKEIQQHADNGQDRLVDKFHDWNIYFLAMLDDSVIGMISVHDRPPFSVASRLPDRSVIEQPGMRPLEVRLLAIDQTERKGSVLLGLTAVMNCFARDNGYTHYVISAVTGQIALYRHLGFEGPIGRDSLAQSYRARYNHLLVNGRVVAASSLPRAVAPAAETLRGGGNGQLNATD
jgi:hypothetical protein